MELRVTITFSDALFELIGCKLPDIEKRFKSACNREINAQVRKAADVQVRTAFVGQAAYDMPTDDTPNPNLGIMGKPAAAPVAADQPEPMPMDDPAEGAETAAPAYTQDDVREAIYRTRARFEGEDWQTNSASEGYKKWHTVLRDEFLRISMTLGAKTPSGLDVDKRAAFIAACDELQEVNGELTTKAPF